VGFVSPVTDESVMTPESVGWVPESVGWVDEVPESLPCWLVVPESFGPVRVPVPDVELQAMGTTMAVAATAHLMSLECLS
jgi:hypothetical protein